MKSGALPFRKRIPAGFVAFAFALAFSAALARGGVSIRTYVGFGLYPYGATNTTDTTPGTGLLANNGSGRALMQLIFAGADNMIGDGSDIADMDNAANGYVAGDDVVWQSRILETGVDDVDGWGFTSTLPAPHTDLAWTTAGFVFVRVFQDETPHLGEAFLDSGLLALDAAYINPAMPPQNLTITGALDSRFAETTSVTRTVGPGQWDLMTVPLIADPTNAFGALAANVPAGTAVYFYDPGLSVFVGGSKSAKGWPAAQSNRLVLPGESFFLSAESTTGHELTIEGEVPPGPVTNQVYERWSALGYPFPDEVPWTDTSLASNLPVGSLVYFWDSGRGMLNTYRKGPPAKGGWGPASNRIVYPGDGFIVRQPPGSAPFLWIQERGE